MPNGDPWLHAQGRGAAEEPPEPSREALDLEGRRALGVVLERLTGQRGSVTLGRYLLGRRVGAGGCGAVYAAHDPELDRAVAIKVVLPARSAHASDAYGQARLLREAQALAKLRHPNVVEVFDVGLDDLATHSRGVRRRRVYIVMELVEGVTLGEWLADERPDPAAILQAFAQAADGLAAAHAVGVVHRDFKPSNVMLTASARVKVLDFGLAREDLEAMSPMSTTGGSARASSPSESLTRTGALMGTPRYMAPEQHAAAPATAASDQYSLAIAVWEALCGAPPFTSESLEAIAAAKRAGAPPRPTTMARPVYEVLTRALHPDPARRFRDMATFADRLRTGPRSRVRASLAVAGVTALGLGALAAGVLADEATPTTCDVASPVAAWRAAVPDLDEAIRAELEVDGWGIGPRITARLHRFADAWGAAHDQLCNPVSDELTEDERLARAQCLVRGQERFDTSVQQLARAPGAFGAHRRIFAMESPARCLHDPPDLPYSRSPEEEAELDALGALAQSITMGESARVGSAPPELARSIDRAKALGDTWTTTQLISAAAVSLTARGDAEGSTRLGLEASWLAEANGDVLLAAELLPSVLALLYDNSASRAEVERFVAHGEDLLAAVDPPLMVRVGFDAMRSVSSYRFGEIDRALAIAEATVALAGDPPAMGTQRYVGYALLTLAEIQIERGALEAAWRNASRMLMLEPSDTRWARALRGPAHSLRATIASDRGDDELAIREALAQIREMSSLVAPDHPAVLLGVSLYGSLLVDRGAVAEGLAHLRGARADMLDGVAGGSHQISTIEHRLIAAEIAHGDPQRAIACADEVLARDLESMGPDSEFLFWAWLDVAGARYAAGDRAGASAALDEVFARLPHDDPDARIEAHALRGKLHLDARRFDHARDDFLASLAELGPHDASSWARGFRGATLLDLARALRGLGDRAQAHAVAAMAEEALARGTHWHRRMVSEAAALRSSAE